MNARLIELAVTSSTETAEVDFKLQWDHQQPGECIELVKDIVAMANSGGGVILIGTDDNGTPINAVDHDNKCDPAFLYDKFSKYTGLQPSFLNMTIVEKNNIQLHAIVIGPTQFPIPFLNPGTYELPDKKQKTVFSRGTVYFRHGAKSEPANHDDFRLFMERAFKMRKKFLLDGIAKVIEAPSSSTIAVLEKSISLSDQPNATAIRITSDPSAPSMTVPMVDKTHPYRQKELLQRANTRLKDKAWITSHDFLCIRRVHNIHRDLKYCYNMNWSSPRYSEACIDWLVDQVTKDDAFIHRSREQYSKIKDAKKDG